MSLSLRDDLGPRAFASETNGKPLCHPRHQLCPIARAVSTEITRSSPEMAAAVSAMSERCGPSGVKPPSAFLEFAGELITNRRQVGQRDASGGCLRIDRHGEAREQFGPLEILLCVGRARRVEQVLQLLRGPLRTGRAYDGLDVIGCGHESASPIAVRRP